MITKLLDELRAQYRLSSPAAPTQALLDALFRVGEEIIGIDWEGDMLVLSPQAQIGFLIRNMLEQWGADKAGERLIQAFQKGTSPPSSRTSMWSVAASWGCSSRSRARARDRRRRF